MISLVGDHKIAEAAHAIDEQVWRAHLALRGADSTHPTWFVLRDEVEDRRRVFTATARRLLNVPGPVPGRLHGRPDRNDPVWGHPQPPPSSTA
jgi:hypothetical protein